MTRAIQIGDIKIGGSNPIVLIAGPCVIESESSALKTARHLKDIARDLEMPFVYKSSYDKANRTSGGSFRGPGLKKGLDILNRIKRALAIPVLSDVHCKEEIRAAKRVLDVIQIPALLSRQTDLIQEAARTGRAINIKKGQFMAPWDMRHAIDKAASTGNKKILLTERGTSFGYNNLVSDFRSILIMKKFGYPIIYDAAHSVQMPAGLGDRSGGQSEFIPHLAMAASACGIDGLFVEVHENPKDALSDGPNMLKLSNLKEVLSKVMEIDRVIKGI